MKRGAAQRSQAASTPSPASTSVSPKSRRLNPHRDNEADEEVHEALDAADDAVEAALAFHKLLPLAKQCSRYRSKLLQRLVAVSPALTATGTAVALEPGIDCGAIAGRLLQVDSGEALHAVAAVFSCKEATLDEGTALQVAIHSAAASADRYRRAEAARCLGLFGHRSHQASLRFLSTDHSGMVRRRAALALLHVAAARRMSLSLQVYSNAWALAGDVEVCVRVAAARLLWHFAWQAPFYTVSSKPRREILCEHAFVRLCELCVDRHARVRAVAVRLLGAMPPTIAPHLLLQTFSKVHLAQLLLSRSHADRRLHFDVSELDDLVPDGDLELLKKVAAVLPDHAAGVFVHGLEDELGEVRLATVDSICSIGSDSELFAVKALDFLVDMFNDELQTVRAAAMQCVWRLFQAWPQLALTTLQLHTALALLQDSHASTRHHMLTLLSHATLPDADALQNTVSALLECLKRFKGDTDDVLQCLRCLGRAHAHFAVFFLEEWFSGINVLRKSPPELTDVCYHGILALLQEASAVNPQLHAQGPSYLGAHLRFCQDQYPQVFAGSKPDALRWAPTSDDAEMCLQTVDAIRGLDMANIARVASDLHQNLVAVVAGHKDCATAALCCVYAQWLTTVSKAIAAQSWASCGVDDAVQRAHSLSRLMLDSFLGVSLSGRFHLLHAHFVSEVLRHRCSADAKASQTAIDAAMERLRAFHMLHNQPKESFWMASSFALDTWLSLKDGGDPAAAWLHLLPVWFPPTNLLLRRRSVDLLQPTPGVRGIGQTLSIRVLGYTSTVIAIVARLHHVGKHDLAHICVRIQFPDLSVATFRPNARHYQAKPPHTLCLSTSITVPRHRLAALKGMSEIQIGVYWNEHDDAFTLLSDTAYLILTV